ncbi:carbohydrate esterase-like sialic acid-specific acetylesterase [Edaphobacter aggregans]|uniref:Carbohydrate esterase-like sialic acid-specific acetylesterase n=1 Tax=Edaphobacter aggregans TaxID=570835 RepID=A0A428MLF9_9BACT|nr:sialate O-acetylesterase [Edaphobacter aggregans]RSL17791.1 carbohydrate esterase-like sialic acid-specific acetylesterase [Edaphobacter aggregans]
MIVFRSCFATKLNLYILLLLLATLRLPAQTTLATLSSPLDYQVFQRQSRQQGTILIRGRVSVPADRVEARIVGQSLPSKWKRLTFDSTTGDFRSDAPTPAGGFYSVEVKLLRKSRTVAELTVPHVGVGEVFLISGQSNSTNYGEVPQTTETGMVTTFSGEAWQLANDPQPGTQDNSKKGSFAPSFGDALYRKYHVPIGIASVGHGSTSVRQWLPTGERVEVMPTMTKYILKGNDGSLTSDGTLFNGMMARIHQLGPHGFRAILWHQGESDSHQPPEHEISGETYRRMLEHVILTTRKQAGWDIPWFVAQASYHTPEDTSTPAIRESQRSLWQAGIALEGPDTDTLTAAYRQNNGKGTHLNDAGLKLHGQMWAHQVELYLDEVLR